MVLYDDLLIKGLGPYALAAARLKAKELKINNGVIVIRYSGFLDMKPNEGRMVYFPLLVGGSQVIPPESNPDGFTCDCLGVAVSKITAALYAYEKSDRKKFLSSDGDNEDNILGRQNWGGCVITETGFGRATIAICVSGGTEEQDVQCALAAQKAIEMFL